MLQERIIAPEQGGLIIHGAHLLSPGAEGSCFLPFISKIDGRV
jgi:hypothetical protein